MTLKGMVKTFSEGHPRYNTIFVRALGDKMNPGSVSMATLSPCLKLP